jgi:ferredoxin-NADP reductase
MRIRLKERRQETADAVSFVFDLGGQQLDYAPGQYLTYELDALAFPDERGKSRHFSISSSPTEKGIVMFTTRMRGSGFKETLRQAPIGYEVTCETPEGEFVMRPHENCHSHIFIAGGIGITPYRSILRRAADEKQPLNALLLYFNRSRADIIFRDELQEIAKWMPSFSLVNVLSNPSDGVESEKGELDQSILRKWIPDPVELCFWVSGPPAMVGACKELLKRIGVEDKRVRSDRFMGY